MGRRGRRGKVGAQGPPGPPGKFGENGPPGWTVSVYSTHNLKFSLNFPHFRYEKERKGKFYDPNSCRGNEY